VCNTQTPAAPSAYTNALAYGPAAQTLGSTFPADLFGGQTMLGCKIDPASYTGANLKIGGTAAAQTLEWTSSDLQ